MAVTIKDIAKRAGVSYSTVSRALNGASCVNEEKKREIERIAKEMGYVPNLAAVQLKKSRSGIIGIYVQDLKYISSTYSMYPMLNAAYEALGCTYSIVVKAISKHIPGSLNPALYDGIIVMDSSADQSDFCKEVNDKGIPLVLANLPINYDAPRVVVNQEKAFYEVMKLIIEKGHKRITILEGEPERMATKLRHSGWMRAVRELDFPMENIDTYDCKFSYVVASEHMPQIMKNKPDAILSFNDEMAEAALIYLRHIHVCVPEQISVVGYDNWNIPMCDSLGLTNIDRGIGDIAKMSVELLKQMIEGKKVKNDLYYIEGKLVDRGSLGTRV
ncbi:MAG: LacI family transcriptional regulator [Lachnospiraceae bacterium]|nr:LacI family transcriptional regulator [Lachnospiraceae bacterium]